VPDLPGGRATVAGFALRLVQGRTTAEAARIVNAVRAQAERFGPASCRAAQPLLDKQAPAG
jgi:hypothetical protein